MGRRFRGRGGRLREVGDPGRWRVVARACVLAYFRDGTLRRSWILVQIDGARWKIFVVWCWIRCRMGRRGPCGAGRGDTTGRANSHAACLREPCADTDAGPGADLERLEKSIAENRFSVSIDNGPWFRATHVRREGDDPISLSILLDVSGGSSALMPEIAHAISGLAPLSLQERCCVSIYVLHCPFKQSMEDAPAERDDLKRAVDSALQMWSYRRQKKHESDCKPPPRLWDALTSIILYRFITFRAAEVALAITDGQLQWQYEHMELCESPCPICGGGDLRCG